MEEIKLPETLNTDILTTIENVQLLGRYYGFAIKKIKELQARIKELEETSK